MTNILIQFCKQGLGKFLHHVPTEAMSSKTQAQEGIKRAWKQFCEGENYRNPFRYALEEINKYNISRWIN